LAWIVRNLGRLRRGAVPCQCERSGLLFGVTATDPATFAELILVELKTKTPK